MIVGNMKPLEEIVDSLSGFRKVLILGCGSCVTVCLSGGDREARQLALELSRSPAFAGSPPVIAVDTIIRQCEAGPRLRLPDTAAGHRGDFVAGLWLRSSNSGRRVRTAAGVPGVEHHLLWRLQPSRCVAGGLSRMRRLHVVIHWRHLSRGPLCQEPVQRSVRWLPKRELRDLRRCSLRLGVDLLPLEKAKQTPPAPHGPSASGLAAGRRCRSAGETANRCRYMKQNMRRHSGLAKKSHPESGPRRARCIHHWSSFKLSRLGRFSPLSPLNQLKDIIVFND